MDLVYNWYDERYQSEMIFSNTLIQIYDLKAKIIDLVYALRFLTAHIF